MRTAIVDHDNALRAGQGKNRKFTIAHGHKRAPIAFATVNGDKFDPGHICDDGKGSGRSAHMVHVIQLRRRGPKTAEHVDGLGAVVMRVQAHL